MSLEQLINHYGYWALLGGTFIEGETILLIAGFLAHQGNFQLGLVMLAAFAGSLAGDQASYILGLLWGKPLLARSKKLRKSAEKVWRFLERYNTPIMVGFRFVYGIRLATPIAIAQTRVSPRRFFFLNALGALLWSVAVSGAGYLFGSTLQFFFNDLPKYELGAMGFILLVMFSLGLTAHYIWKKI